MRLKSIHTLFRFAVLAPLAIWASAHAGQPASPEAVEFFEKSVRPILAGNCYECHGPEKHKAQLRLDHISTILKGSDNGPILDLADPAKSKMLEALGYENVDLQMPPDGKLDAAKIDVLRRWIEMGAPWPDEPVPGDTAPLVQPFDLVKRRAEHWAWRPVQPYRPPAVVNAEWSSTPIDRFVLAKLEEHDLRPAAPADQRAIVRRLYFDLTGLPPTPAQVDAFLTDTSPDAYEKVVDRLLASPHFGERWGRHWLDLVRYAETYGHEADYPVVYAWRYRDYVIRALNDDVPYNRFVLEHLAGDLLPDPRINPQEGYNESVLATGSWFMHQATHAPVDPAQDEADRVDNQLDVLSKAFLGLTVACARCHDHKFDAISTRDYYALSGFMQSSRESIAYLDPFNTIADALPRIEQTNAEARALLADAFQSAAEKVDVAAYLNASREVMYGEWKPGDGPGALKEDIVFADFEGDGFEGWTVEGSAFGDGPEGGALEGQSSVAGYVGARFASSFHGDDASTGRMLSRPFAIERKFIHFYVGGGTIEGKTCVNLLVNGESVRTTAGKGNERLEGAFWDVGDLIGQAGQIEVLDAETADGGHVQADHFVFSEDLYPESITRPVDVVASEAGLDPVRLEQWIHALQSPEARAATSPLYAFTKLAPVAADFPAQAEALRAERSPPPDAFEVYEDFSPEGYARWMPAGQAFRDAPSHVGDWQPAGDRAQVPLPGTANSGLIADELQGTLRSPDFTLEDDSIHFRMAGVGGQIRLVVEQYQLAAYNGILFGNTIVNVNTGGEFVWHNMTHDLSKWKGRTCYIELIDDGDGWIAVDEISFSDGAPPSDEPYGLTPDLLAGVAAMADLTSNYQTITANALRAFADATASSAQAGLLRALISQDLLDLGPNKERFAKLATGRREFAATVPRPVRAMTMTEGTPADNYIHIRGSYKNVGEPSPRRFLEVIDGADWPPLTGGSGRLELAQRLLDGVNPLPARVAVNRVWHHLFGQGIVPTVDNFGLMGQAPTHPELLDYLATKFVRDGWSIKSLIRDIVTSETYRMSSAASDALAEERDPANVWLHRMRVKRLEGEVLRDTLLAVAGTLDTKMFGESVPTYLTPFMSYHRRPEQSGPMDGDRRRSIYLEVRRNFLAPMLLAYDMPAPETTIGRRTVSNVPAQALILMNDPFVVDQAKAWSDRLLGAGATGLDDQIKEVFLEALSRPPTDNELVAMRAFVEKQANEKSVPVNEAVHHPEIWLELCHVVFTLKEFSFIG